MLFPDFGDIEIKGTKTPTDWNDFAALFGKERLAAAIRLGLTEKGIDMEEIEKPKVTQEMRDAVRQTTTIQQQDQQAAHAREVQRQDEQQHDRGIER